MLVFGLGGSSDVIVCDALGRRARLFSKYPQARWSLRVFLIMRHDPPRLPVPPRKSRVAVWLALARSLALIGRWKLAAPRAAAPVPAQAAGGRRQAAGGRRQRLPCLRATSGRCLPAPDSGASRQTLTNCPACCPALPATRAAKPAEIGLKTVNCRKARNGCPSEQS